MKLSDVTPELSLKAYEATGLRPVACQVYNRHANCGCLLGALYLYTHPDEEIQFEDDIAAAYTDLLEGETGKQDAVDLSFGFDAGFTNSLPGYESEAYKKGYAIGQEILRWVMNS